MLLVNRYPLLASRLLASATFKSRPTVYPTRCFASMAPSNGTMSPAALNAADFQRIGEGMAAYDEKRESVIKRCRDIQKNAKQAIFSLHRGKDAEAEARLGAAAEGAADVSKIIKGEPDLRHGSYSAAMEESAEAMLFRGFLREGRLLTSVELPSCNRDEYLGGVLDFTGELNRYAVARATERDVAAVTRCRDLVEAIFGQFLQYDLRNGAIRKKFDSLKYTLKKLETLLYELSLAKSGLPARDSSPVSTAVASTAGAH